jgi:hypothetical protein
MADRKLSGRWQRAYDRLRQGGYTALRAHNIARTLHDADVAGLNIEWRDDPDGESSAGEGDDGPWWGVIATDEDGTVLDSLWGISLGETGPDAHHSILYQYDAEAQVLGEALGLHIHEQRNPTDIPKGTRVQLHAATDQWMQGDRYGEVVGRGRTRDFIETATGKTVQDRPYLVRLDKSGKTVRLHPDNLFAID